MFIIHVTWAGKIPTVLHNHRFVANMRESLRITCSRRRDMCRRCSVPDEGQAV
jgi:hypothetical protein